MVGFGLRLVIGRSLVPRPAARIRPFMAPSVLPGREGIDTEQLRPLAPGAPAQVRGIEVLLVERARHQRTLEPVQYLLKVCGRWTGEARADERPVQQPAQLRTQQGRRWCRRRPVHVPRAEPG